MSTELKYTFATFRTPTAAAALMMATIAIFTTYTATITTATNTTSMITTGTKTTPP
jgi:hypothetical protein